MDLIEEQLRLERSMIGYGVDQYRTNQRKAVARGQGSDTVPSRSLTAAVIPTLADAIRKFVDDANAKGKAGRRNLAAKYLAQFDPEIVAMISVRRMLDVGSENHYLTRVANQIGNALRMEKRLEDLIERDPDRFENVTQSFKTNHRAHREKVWGVHLTDAGIERYDDIIRVGTKCVELVVEATGLFTIYRASGRTKRYWEVRPTDRLVAWIRDQDARCETLRPFHLPTVVPPKPWSEDGMEGGYYLGEIREGMLGPFGLIKTPVTPVVSPAAVEALNTVQGTPWRLNRGILKVLRTTWDLGHEIGGIPPREQAPLPLCPKCGGHVQPKSQGGHACLEDEEVRKQWRRMTAQVWEQRVSMTDRRTQAMQTLFVAEQMERFDRFWFPHKFDFRGRLYPMPSHLQPQGPDYARALLEFAEGKPIENERAAGWLMIHGANCWGHDKVSLEERIAWVSDNRVKIIACGRNPLVHRWWTEADKPWQFLAFCMEYAQFILHGYGFVSHLPITVDGSCNGLQHFSAMLRDEVGGRAVNLVPQEKPADVYQEVADVVISRLTMMVVEGDCGASQAQQWLDFGINRKTVKRSVMIVPYSGTINACRRYIQDHIRERIAQWPGGDPPFEDDFQAAVFLSKHVWAAIEQVIRSSREVMQWLRQCAKLQAKTHKPLVWRNPMGFDMVQWYPDWEEKRLKTRFGETLMKLSYKEVTDEVVSGRMMNGISPNFVHSLDACALMSTVLLGTDNGITSWITIHDCYGTHAADMDMLGACLREAFVDLYEVHDPLQTFYEQILEQVLPEDREDVPPPPAKSGLDIGTVRQSDFFFA